MLSWNLNNKYGIVQVQPQPLDQIICKPPDKRSFYTGITLSTNADGTYEVEFACEVRIREYDNGVSIAMLWEIMQGQEYRERYEWWLPKREREMKKEALADMF